jgi:hypothetical protein
MSMKYAVGNKTKGGAAYNPISLEYDRSNDGNRLKIHDDDKKVRALIRG